MDFLFAGRGRATAPSPTPETEAHRSGHVTCMSPPGICCCNCVVRVDGRRNTRANKLHDSTGDCATSHAFQDSSPRFIHFLDDICWLQGTSICEMQYGPHSDPTQFSCRAASKTRIKKQNTYFRCRNNNTAKPKSARPLGQNLTQKPGTQTKLASPKIFKPAQPLQNPIQPSPSSYSHPGVYEI